MTVVRNPIQPSHRYGGNIQLPELTHLTKSPSPTRKELIGIVDKLGLKWTEYSDAPGTKYTRHKHDFDDFIVILSGQMKLGTDKGMWVLKPGDRLDLPANTIHWAEVVGKAAVHYLSATQ